MLNLRNRFPSAFLAPGECSRGSASWPSRARKNPPTDKEKAALFDTMFAYVGTYVVEADRVIHTLDGSWNELWTGTRQTRLLSFEDRNLVYTTPETVDPMDGKLCTYKVTFARA